mmetsp:Transcript_8432/g.14118  ORF Transcript_8432/g.14118 Transcript_8432/m.14118 type:complete len:814 (-) Transcript_8432:18-2459(-)
MARSAEKHGKLLRFLFMCYSAAQPGGPKLDKESHLNVPNLAVDKDQFSAFIRFYYKELSEVQVLEIFLNVSKRLHALLQSPNGLRQSLGSSTGLTGKGSNQDVRDMVGRQDGSQGLNSYGMTEAQMSQMGLDLAVLDQSYEKWTQEDDSLSGVMNPKLTKQKNADLRLKLEAWRSRAGERKAAKKRANEHGKALRKQFESFRSLFSVDRDKALKCVDDFGAFLETQQGFAKECKAINDFLSALEEGAHHFIEQADLERLAKNEGLKFAARLAMLQEFVAVVKQECVINQHFFIFLDIPDLVVKRRYKREEYGHILKVLLKVKARYLADKARSHPEKPPAQLQQITDDDLVPLELFDFVLAELQNKSSERRQTIAHFLAECHSQVAKAITKLQIDSEKTKKIVEQSVLAHFLNQRLEQRNTTYFANNFRMRLLHGLFVRQINSGAQSLRSAKDLEQHFGELMKPEHALSKFNAEFKSKLEREALKFNGKFQADAAETNSEATNATRATRKSSMAGQRQSNSPSKASLNEEGDGSARRGDPLADGLRLEGEDDEAGEELAEEARARREKQRAEELFVDAEGKPFDPVKKFGTIGSDSLIYDNVTTSYPAVLSVDYYQRYLAQILPTQDAGNGKWFIRPHHLETLTQHPLSVKDDVMNTRYISHYNRDYGKKEEKNNNGDAVRQIEEHLAALKQGMSSLMQSRGEDPGALEELRERLKLEAHMAYEKFVNDKTRFASKELIIEAYEGILTEQRRQERELLNGQRFKEYEKNRPPPEQWYEIKTGQFSKELYRNRMALKPNDSNSVYLATLQDKQLY